MENKERVCACDATDKSSHSVLGSFGLGGHFVFESRINLKTILKFAL